jgi:hypothetical protein
MTRGLYASLGFVLPLALLVSALGAAACAKRDDEQEADGGLLSDAGFDAHLDDAPHDARYEEMRAALVDAGRFCGADGLPDCPLQAWMKRYANTMIGFGDISAIAEVFDRMAALAPDDFRVDGRPTYPNWVSIARDGANAARAGDINAAKAACRGCHSQYLPLYHRELRARALPPG